MLLIILLILIITLFTFIVLNRDSKDIGFALIACIIFSILSGALIAIKINTPTAMDVYKGKTTLKITYRDNIPVDSVVVFKNK